MKSIIKLSAVLATLGVLAGCAAGPSTADRTAAIADRSGPFNAALFEHYIGRAEYETTELDVKSEEFFRSRAEMAARGNTPVLQHPAQRKLLVDVREINLAYPDLAAALKGDAPRKSPDACARAQVWFEQWMEQSAEGNQISDIRIARVEFEDAMAKCSPKMAQDQPQAQTTPQAAPVAAMPADLPQPVVIYFDHDSSELTPDGAAALDRAVRAAKQARATHATVIGHTDRSGTNAYNMALSERRAYTVARALRDAGIPTVLNSASYAGETDTRVNTQDGVREEQNRRVVVTFLR